MTINIPQVINSVDHFIIYKSDTLFFIIMDDVEYFIYKDQETKIFDHVEFRHISSKEFFDRHVIQEEEYYIEYGFQKDTNSNIPTVDTNIKRVLIEALNLKMVNEEDDRNLIQMIPNKELINLKNIYYSYKNNFYYWFLSTGTIKFNKVTSHIFKEPIVENGNEIYQFFNPFSFFNILGEIKCTAHFITIENFNSKYPIKIFTYYSEYINCIKLISYKEKIPLFLNGTIKLILPISYNIFLEKYEHALINAFEMQIRKITRHLPNYNLVVENKLKFFPTTINKEKAIILKFPSELIYLKLVLHIILLKEYNYNIQNMADGDIDFIPFSLEERLNIINFNDDSDE